MMPPYTPDELRALAKETGPQWDGTARAALVYAADVLEAADRAVREKQSLPTQTHYSRK